MLAELMDAQLVASLVDLTAVLKVGLMVATLAAK
jgi:hypothetical protein